MKFTMILIAFILRLIRFSCRKKWYGLDNLEAAKQMAPNRNYAVAIWHQNIFSCVLNMRELIISMTSQSKDGQIAADVSEMLGNVKNTRGSSSKGGKSAMEQMIKMCNEEKLPAGLTVDGPRGPSFVPKRGLFKIAHDCNMPVVPYYGISSKMKVLPKSWDKFRIGFPFATFHMYYGKPFMIESLDDDALKSYSEKLTEELFNLEKNHFHNFPEHREMIESQLSAKDSK